MSFSPFCPLFNILYGLKIAMLKKNQTQGDGEGVSMFASVKIESYKKSSILTSFSKSVLS